MRRRRRNGVFVVRNEGDGGGAITYSKEPTTPTYRVCPVCNGLAAGSTKHWTAHKLLLLGHSCTALAQCAHTVCASPVIDRKAAVGQLSSSSRLQPCVQHGVLCCIVVDLSLVLCRSLAQQLRLLGKQQLGALTDRPTLRSSLALIH